MAGQQRQQPFFRTTANSSTTSGTYFLNYNTNTNKNGNQGNQLQQSAPASRTNFFAPNSTVSRQKDKESERETIQTTERLSALHNKLHQEAEKIRKWKTKTDLELHDKTKKLQDADQTIECQKKSILELQFQNEKLSSKLQEEIAGQIELEQKAVATRELSTVLKDQVLRIDKTIAAGEQDREELHYSEKQRLAQFQELVVKFQELEIQHSTKYNEMKDKLQKQHERHSTVIAETTQNIHEKEKQIAVLSEDKVEKDFKISALIKDLGENREHLEATKNEEAALKDKLKKSESIITSQDMNLKSVNEMLIHTQDENKKLMSKTCEKDRILAQLHEEKLTLEQMLKEEGKQYILKTETFQANIIQLTNEIDKHKARIKELTDNVDMLKKELEHKEKHSDELKNETEKLLKETEELRESNEKLTCYQEDLIKCLRELEAEKNSLQKKTLNLTEKENEFKTAQESSKQYITELEKEKESLEKDIESNLKALLEKGSLVENLQMDLRDTKKKEHKLQEKIEKLESVLREKSLNQNSITSHFEEIKAEKLELQKELQLANKDIEDMNLQIKNLQKSEAELKKELGKSASEREKLKAEVSQLNNEHQEKRDELDQTLDNEINNTKALRQQLVSKEKELNSLENKNKTLQNQLTSKTKQHKDLQQEIKTLKNNSTTQTKKIKVLERKNETMEVEIEKKNSENDYLQEENKNLKEEIGKMKKENAKEIKDLKQLQSVVDKGVAHRNDLEEEIKKLKNTTEKALKDKDEAKCSFDKDRAELCATLENYKAENEAIIAQKEKDLEKFKHNKEIEMEKQLKKIKELEQQLDVLNKSRLESEKAKNKEIMDKNAEINILKEQLEKAINTSSRIDHPEQDEETSEDVEMQRVAETPSRAEHIVPSTPKTPRSILKQSAQPSKKRRVAFSYEKSKSYSSDEDDKAYKIFKPSEKKSVPGKGTSPAIPTKAVRPNVRHSPAPSQASVLARKSNQSPFSKTTKKNSPKEVTLDDELKQFNELFPNINYQPEKKSVAGKGKRASFRGKKTQISPRKKQPDVDWFDNDAFFGFDG